MTRTPFSHEEKAYLTANNPGIFGFPKSYAQIADELNRLYPNDNHGCRTRESVKEYYTVRRKDPIVIRQVRIPAEISKTLSGSDLTRIVVSHCEKLGTKTE